MGVFYVIHDELNYKLKRIEVNPNSRLSYQYHNKRSECWTIVQGSGIITIDGVDKKISNGESIKLNRDQNIEFYNNTLDTLVFIEVQTGSYFGEDDIIRVEDDYNR